MTGDPTTTTAETVRALAAVAQLPLPSERLEVVAPQLGEWLDAANELSAKMSAPEYAALMPAVVFTHPDVQGVGE